MMKRVWKIAIRYINYYKGQSIAIFFSIILSMGLITGIGTLLHSGRERNYEESKRLYGSWHCVVAKNFESEEQLKSKVEGYEVEKAGLWETKEIVEKPWNLEFVYADETCRNMLGRELEKGSYPQRTDEVALDYYTIQSLGVSDEIGDYIILGGERYKLSGIVSNQWDANVGEMQAFVSEKFPQKEENNNWYVSFKEKNVYHQIENFMAQYSLDNAQININTDIVDYIGGISISEAIGIIRTGIHLPEGKIGYILGNLKTRCNILENGILLCIGVFGAFVIYSIFHISIYKRLSQYGVLYTLGIGDRTIFSIILSELCIIFAVGYPIGCFLGNIVVRIFFKRIGTAFVEQNIGSVQAGVHISQAEKFFAASTVDAGSFMISWKAVWFGMAVFLILLCLISYTILKKIQKYTVIQIMRGNKREICQTRKIYSKKHSDMVGVLTRKFMFANSGSFLGMIVSLALGGIIFLGSTFAIENTRVNNQLVLKTDDGLGSELQISEQSSKLSDTIPQEVITNIEKLDGIEGIYPVKYWLGEFPLSKEQVIWDSYCAEIANDPSWKPDSVIMEKYNGQCLREENGNYKMKCNVYGYEDVMLEQMEQYTLEGEINPVAMKQENTVILKTWMDGQGGYEGIDLKVGDSIKLKVPKNETIPDEVLRFKSADEYYTEKEFVISAIVSRPMVKNNNFIGDDGTSSLDIIMTNQQMQENFGIEDYNMASILMKQGYDSTVLVQEISQFTNGISKCAIKDNTGAIEAHEIYLKQKMYFFYAVTVIIVIVSMLHMLNSLNYLMISRKREFGILRAMGITDSGFLKMIMKEGFYYGVCASIVTLVFYMPIRAGLYYLMRNVWLYIMPQKSLPLFYYVGIVGMNILVCVVAVLISVRVVLKKEVVSELKI